MKYLGDYAALFKSLCITNGIILKGRISDWPELELVDSICVSLEGDKIVHEKIRGKGSFDKTMEGILAGVKAGLPIRIHATTSKASFEADSPPPQDFLAELCKKHAIPFNIATYCPNPTKDFVKDKENRGSFLNAQKVYQDLLKYKKLGYPVTTSSHILKTGIEWLNYERKYTMYHFNKNLPKQITTCQGGIRCCFIDYDGCMYACIPYWKTGISAYDHGLDKAFEYMNKHRLKEDCFNCYILALWEYSGLFTLSDPKLIWNTFKYVISLNFKKKIN